MKLFGIGLIVFFSFLQIASAQDSWQHVNNGLGGDSLIRCAIVRQNGKIYIGTSEGGYVSTNHGLNWSALISPGIVTVQSLAFDKDAIYAGMNNGISATSNEGANWYVGGGFPSTLVLAIMVNDSGFIYGGTDLDGLYRSKVQGSYWEKLTGLPSENITALVNFGGRTLFVGTDGQGVYRSTDNGQSWIQATNGITDSLIRALAVTSDGKLFAGTNSGGVFRSSDSGETWREANVNLTTPFIGSLIVHPNGTLYAGTSGGGVFRSTNDGGSWTELNTGLTNLFVSGFAVDSSGYLFACTAGGMFRSVNPTTSVVPKSNEQPAGFHLDQNFPNPFNPATTIGYTIPERSHVRIELFNMLGQRVRLVRDAVEIGGGHAVRLDAADLSSGTYVYRVEVRGIEASDRVISETRKLVIIR